MARTTPRPVYIKIWCDVNLLLFDRVFIIHVQTLYRSNNPCFSAYVPNSGGIKSGLFVWSMTDSRCNQILTRKQPFRCSWWRCVAMKMCQGNSLVEHFKIITIQCRWNFRHLYIFVNNYMNTDTIRFTVNKFACFLGFF